MGLFDLPATFDYITNKTGYEKIAYVGHSHGTTQMFYGLANNEEYFKSKISVVVALAPVTKISHTKVDLLRVLTDVYGPGEDLLKTLGVHSLFTKTWIDSYSKKIVCGYYPELCLFFEKTIATRNVDLDDLNRFNVWLAHFPSGTSLRTIIHQGQILKEDRFQEWAPEYHKYLDINDYVGESKGKRVTDLIPLEKIKNVPIAIFVGDSDTLATVADAEWTRDTVGDAVTHF